MKLRNNRSSTIEDKVLEAIQQRGAGDYIAEGLGTGVTSALGFVGDRKNRIGQQALDAGRGLTGEYKRRRDASPEFTEINIRGNTGQLPSGDSRLQDLATYNLPGMSLETLSHKNSTRNRSISFRYGFLDCKKRSRKFRRSTKSSLEVW